MRSKQTDVVMVPEVGCVPVEAISHPDYRFVVNNLCHIAQFCVKNNPQAQKQLLLQCFSVQIWCMLCFYVLSSVGVEMLLK